MKFLITGSNGLTGQKLVAQLIKAGHPFLATSSGPNRNPDCPSASYRELDISNAEIVAQIVTDFKPEAVINAAAMTNVDHCEDQPELCRKINTEGVNNLLNACQKSMAHLIHISTDFVFDGQSGPYKEEDERNPLSVYATSKFDAENILLHSAYPNWTILRTIIVYGRCHNMSRSNLVLWTIDSLRNRKSMNVVTDQLRAPTWADDLAWACIRCAELKCNGVFHVSGPVTFSIYDIACQIAGFLKADQSLIIPISSASLNQKAKRPPKTGFILEKARNVLGYYPKSLAETLPLLTSEPNR